jgi:hypothetical protein
MEHVPINDSPSHALHQVGVRNRVKGNHHTLPNISSFPNV